MIHEISNYNYKAKILSVYDGDGKFDVLMTVKIDIGMNEVITHERRKTVRLFGVDTPEIRGVQHAAGIIVRDYVRKLILGEDVVLCTYKDKTGKYGRLLADIIVGGDNELSLGEHLVNIGYAKPYNGGKKQEWTMEEIDAIIFGAKNDT